jgi:peptidoglycan/xylan/chitin deacetylase (PgdA/CDA1 family)
MSSYAKFATAQTAHGIMFHHFHGEGHPVSQGSIDANRLADMIKFIEGKFQILDSREWVEKSLAGRLRSNELCLTFDDALLGQKEVALPVLEALDIKGIFFVYSSVFEGGLERLEIYRAFRTIHFDSVEEFYSDFFPLVDEAATDDGYKKAMEGFKEDSYLADFPFYSDDDRKFRFIRDVALDNDSYNKIMDGMIERVTSIQKLSKSLWMQDSDLVDLVGAGHVIGLHSYSHHTTLADLNLSDQHSEYSRNVDHLKNVLGDYPASIAHPCNSYTDETLNILNNLGIRLGFRSNMAQPDKVGLEHPREDHANILAMMEQDGS